MMEARPYPGVAGWWEQHRLFLVLALAMWVAATIAVSVLPGAAITAVPPRSDKAGHAVLYGVLTLLLRLVLSRGPVSQAVCVACGLGALLELVQLRVPGRSSDVIDILWNCAGSVLGAAIAAWIMSPRGEATLLPVGGHAVVSTEPQRSRSDTR